MRDLALLLIHLLTTVVRLLGPGGARSVVAESLLVKHQLLVLNRTQSRAPALRPTDRVVAGVCAILIRPRRLLRSTVILKPSTILRFHRALVKRKYHLLFTPKNRAKPGPVGPSSELIAAILEMNHRNPGFGYQRIAEQISLVFGLHIDRDLARRVLAKNYRPEPGSNGPSWLTFLGHSKDSLWSVDMFRCESLLLNTHWVMLVMDQCTRRIIGFGVHSGAVDGPVLCRMFNRIVAGRCVPTYLSSDNDPLFRYHQWQANLRILNVSPVKSVPYVQLSHPFVERLIGTVRREFLDQVPFWSAHDLDRKLCRFRDYYNRQRTHQSLAGEPPAEQSARSDRKVAHLHNYRWKKHCRGLYQLPEAA